MTAKKELNPCPLYSEYIYGWAGELKYACHRHTNAMAALSKAMGAPFSAEPDIIGMRIVRRCDHQDDLEPEKPQ